MGTELESAAVSAPAHLVQALETASSAVAAKAKALVESRYIMALRKPRDLDVVRQKLLAECRRPGFAHNKSVYYRKPIGDGIEGLGIRFVEAALRCMTNVLVEVTTTYEDDQKRILSVCVTDLENNVPYSKDVTVSKTVERSKVPDGVTATAKRLNSYGKWVYTVPATDDDLLNKEGALVSKAIRTLGLRIIPGDLQDEAEALVLTTRRDEAAKDPAANRKKLVDGFAEVGITAPQLVEYLSHPIDQITPDEIVTLRDVYAALRDKEITWGEVMATKRGTDTPANAQGASAEPKAPPAANPSQRLKDRLQPATPTTAAAPGAPAAAPGPAPAPEAPAAPAAADKPARKPRTVAAAPTPVTLPEIEAPAAEWVAMLRAQPEAERSAFVERCRTTGATGEVMQALEDTLDDLALGG